MSYNYLCCRLVRVNRLPILGLHQAPEDAVISCIATNWMLLQSCTQTLAGGPSSVPGSVLAASSSPVHVSFSTVATSRALLPPQFYRPLREDHGRSYSYGCWSLCIATQCDLLPSRSAPPSLPPSNQDATQLVRRGLGHMCNLAWFKHRERSRGYLFAIANYRHHTMCVKLSAWLDLNQRISCFQNRRERPDFPTRC